MEELPAIVEELERRWRVKVGSTFTGGTAAYVAAATTADGTEAVVKLAMPAAIDGDDAFERSVLTFGLAGGRGCARLIAHDFVTERELSLTIMTSHGLIPALWSAHIAGARILKASRTAVIAA